MERPLVILLASLGLVAGLWLPLPAAEAKLAITDRGISVAVESDLSLDRAVPPATIKVNTSQGIKVRVDAGRVMLTGEIGSLLERDRSEEDGWVNGVQAVDVSGLKVNPEIARKVLRKAFFSVTPEPAEAQDAASRIKGVVEVRNHLKIEPECPIGCYDRPYDNRPPAYVYDAFGPQPCPGDAQIKKTIEKAFFWSPFVHRDDIKVTVDGGVAVLTGRVGSWISYEEANRDAVKGGASAVVNKLNVVRGAWL